MAKREYEVVDQLDKEEFACLMRKGLEKRKMTQEQLAEQIGVSRNTIAQMCTGKRFTSIPTLIKICDILEITPDFLLKPYLKEAKPEKMSQDEYHKVLSIMHELRSNELGMLYGIIDLIIRNRSK